MLLPAILYGSWKEVKPRARNVVRELKRGVAFDEAMTREGMVDTQRRSGLIVLENPRWFEAPCFHLSAVSEMLLEHLGTSEEDYVIREHVASKSLESTWGIACQLSRISPVVGHRCRKWWRPYLSAVGTLWAELDGEGPRYSIGMDHGMRLWEVPSSLKVILATMGVPVSVISEPLPPEGLIGLLRYAKTEE